MRHDVILAGLAAHRLLINVLGGSTRANHYAADFIVGEK